MKGAALLAVLLVTLTLATASSANEAGPTRHAATAVAASPRSLVVALALEQPRLQAGVVRGRDVLLARGFEVELARILARRLGARVDRFVYVPSATRLLAGNGASWHLAFGGLERSRTGGGGGRLTAPYLTTDVAVVTRRGLARPRALAELGAMTVCAARGTAGARALTTLRTRRATLLTPGEERLQAVLRAGVCDAALVPALELGRFLDGRRAAFGPVVGRIRHGAGIAAAVPGRAGLEVGAVNRQLARLRRDGTLARLARTWLGVDPAGVTVLR